MGRIFFRQIIFCCAKNIFSLHLATMAIGSANPDLLFLYIKMFVFLPVVFKSNICHIGKPGLIPVFKMASKTVASYRNDPRNNNACLNQILAIKFCF